MATAWRLPEVPAARGRVCQKRASGGSGKFVGKDHRFCRHHRSVRGLDYGLEMHIASGCVINRYYDPSTGQFLSVDPLSFLTGEPFAYAGDNPINMNDPLGLCASKKHCSWWNPLCAVNSAWHAVTHFVKKHERLLIGIGVVLVGVALAATGVGLTIGLGAVINGVLADATAEAASEFVAELVLHGAFVFAPGLVVSVLGGGFISVGGRIIFDPTYSPNQNNLL